MNTVIRFLAILCLSLPAAHADGVDDIFSKAQNKQKSINIIIDKSMTDDMNHWNDHASTANEAIESRNRIYTDSDTPTTAANEAEFEIVKSIDSGSWEWYSREIHIKCTQGRYAGDSRSLYQNRKSGSWTAGNIVGNEKTMRQAGIRACEN